MKAAAGFLCFVLALLGCATSATRTTRRPDGTYDVRCKKRLVDCLVEVEQLCGNKHYLILRAADDRNMLGATPANWEERTSRAIILCGTVTGWEKTRTAVMGPDEEPNPALSPPAAVVPPPPPAPPPPLPVAPPPPADGGTAD